jgi:Malectin-like domain
LVHTCFVDISIDITFSFSPLLNVFALIDLLLLLHFFLLFRYPDDPFDRIWESDASQTQSDLALYKSAPGTQQVATNKTIFVNQGDMPPMKIMQTAVVGNKGLLNYTISLPHFPGNAWVSWYLAEIEDRGPNETRNFYSDFSTAGTNNMSLDNDGVMIEGGYWNAPLPSIAPLQFIQAKNSSRGPILNALEILKYVLINFGSHDSKFV